MQIEDASIPLDAAPPVPAQLRSQLNKLMRSTTRIVISEDEGGGKISKINAIRLTNTIGSFPQEPLETIAEAVVSIMHAHWAAQETEDPEIGLPPVDFVVSCEHKKGTKRVRPQFHFVYAGELGSEGYEENLSVEEYQTQRAMDILERQNGSLLGQLDLAHTKLLSFIELQATAQAAQGAASAETMKQAIPMFFAGVQTMLNAKYLEYNAAKADAEERSKTERLIGGIKAVAPFVTLAASQFLAKKFGIDPATLAQMMDLGGDHSTPSNGAPSGPTAPDTDAPDDVQIPEHLIAWHANALGESLTNRQRRELSRTFTKQQLGALEDLFCASTDDEARAAYEVVFTKAGPQLVAFQQLLEPEQRQILTGFFQTLQHAGPGSG